MAVGGGGEAAGADEGVVIAGEVEDDRTVWDRADVTARWDRRDRDKRCFIAMTDSLRLSLSLSLGFEWRRDWSCGDLGRKI